MNEFIERLRNHLLGDSDVAGINHTPGDFGFDVGLTDGTEFHVEVTDITGHDVNRSAVTGQFVSEAEAEANPDTTVTEHIE